MQDQMPNGLKPSLPLAGACQQHPRGGRALLLQWRWEGAGGARPARLRQALLQWLGRERLQSTPLPTLQQAAGPSAGWLTQLSAPSCHLPLQSISGSCMWVTQQHCSQAQEAAAELKGLRRSSERCTLLPPGSLDCPALCTLGDSRIFN